MGSRESSWPSRGQAPGEHPPTPSPSRGRGLGASVCPFAAVLPVSSRQEVRSPASPAVSARRTPFPIFFPVFVLPVADGPLQRLGTRETEGTSVHCLPGCVCESDCGNWGRWDKGPFSAPASGLQPEFRPFPWLWRAGVQGTDVTARVALQCRKHTDLSVPREFCASLLLKRLPLLSLFERKSRSEESASSHRGS